MFRKTSSEVQVGGFKTPIRKTERCSGLAFNGSVMISVLLVCFTVGFLAESLELVSMIFRIYLELSCSSLLLVFELVGLIAW